MNARIAAVRLLCVGGLAIALSACGITETINEKNKIDYKSSTKAPKSTLEIPPDLTNPRNDERYAIPERGGEQRTLSGFQRGQAAERAPTEGRLLPAVEGVRVERAGNQRWLVVKLPADRVWPVVREFWQESGFIVQTELPEAGILETDWAENRAKLPQDPIRNTIGKVFDSIYSTGERDKFRTRLERNPEGTEIYITHRGMVEVYSTERKDATVWQPRPSDPELEAEFLRRLMVKFGAEDERTRQVATRASGPSTPERARLVNDPAGAKVEIAEGFDRAWRRVGLALDRGGFTVEDRDRSQGMYFVRYIDPEIEAQSGGKPGFFARLFSSGSKDPVSSRQYRVRVAASGETSSVSVQTREGQPVSSEADLKTAGKMMALLHEQLKQ
jgi:outer membrane protein assembly factor BamC